MFEDRILNEVEKVTLIIARLIGLKKADKSKEYIQLADNMLPNEYNIKLQDMLDLTTDNFELLLAKENYSVGKLDTLAQLLYMHTEPFSPDPETLATLQKVLIIFDLLEQKHHQSSFEHINKRKIIHQFVQNNL
ncbi:hypothetical protein [Mucilaginibacter sp. SP1R1]|uniref:hypothetical protein n=1 Tax=Mucilaginibacter sp. SP1R1 TaxID=2723091 RepID=UPI001617BE1A|nr:hypothetical protein [Mucilaginibacter sp. SP1R1]MBB6152158.1 hypothetical protein [Mucilaginibacter sp. SP1R1]